MKKGIGGFRLDVADELSDDFLETLNSKLKGINPNGIIYGEVWEDASNKIAYETRKKYFLGNELDSVMNYPLREAIVEYVKHGNTAELLDTFTMLYSHYPKESIDSLMNVLGTHDTDRILTVLGGENSDGYTNEQLSTKKMTDSEFEVAINRLKMAYAINATVPGIPCIFYGDEVGMQGYRDPFNRLPFPWGRENSELLGFYRKIGEIRAKEPLYKDGLFRVVHLDSSVLAFARYDQKSCIVTVVNRGDTKVEISSNCRLKNLINNKVETVINNNSIGIFKFNKNLDTVDFGFDIKTY
jgi:glycosidase